MADEKKQAPAPQKKKDPAPQKKEGSSAPDKTPRLPDVAVTVSMELGRTIQTLNDVLSIGEQSLIELDKMVGDPIDIYLNGKLFARGEVVTVSENFGVRVTEILNQE